MARRLPLFLLLLPLHGGILQAADLKAAPARTKTAAIAASKDSRPTPETALAAGKLAYERGDYGTAIQKLRPLLYPTAVLADESQVVLGHKLLGLSCLFEHDEPCAEQEFNLLLSLRPDFALDPVVEPVSAVAFFDSIRRKNQERLQEVRRRQEEEDLRRRADEEERRRQDREKAQRIYVERVVRSRVGPLLFVPFGVPQLVSGRRVPAAIFLAGEALCGSASLATWLTVRFRYPAGTFPPGELRAAQALTATYLTTGAVFWALVATGLVDALLHARTVVEVRELPGPPPELRKAAPKPKKLTLRPAPLAFPLLQAQASLPTPPAPVLGLSLSGSF